MLERFRGMRTFFHCTWITIAGLVLAFKDQLDVFGVDVKSLVGEYVPTPYVGLTMVGLAALFAIMRADTHTGPFKSE
jgi:hypothetical protein